MKVILRRFSFFLTAVTIVAIFAGCATQKIDWSSRVGTQTYQQAVIELGPPDKKEKLDDGTIVAEWLTHHGYVYSVPQTSPYWWNGPFYPDIESSPNWYLRLIFAPDGKLRDWKRFAK